MRDNTFPTPLLLAGFLIVLAWSSFAAAAPIPEIKKDCSLCHPSSGTGEPRPELLKKLSDLCLDCHPDRKSPAEHRFDIVPSMPVRDLPLSDGRITCVTCHDPHADPYRKMLRVQPKDLCLQCHRY